MGCNCGGSRWTPVTAEAQAAAAARGALVPVDTSAYYWGGPDQAAQPDPADEPAAQPAEA